MAGVSHFGLARERSRALQPVEAIVEIVFFAHFRLEARPRRGRGLSAAQRTELRDDPSGLPLVGLVESGVSSLPLRGRLEIVDFRKIQPRSRSFVDPRRRVAP